MHSKVTEPTYVQLLNELLRINNDRIEGYKKVLRQLHDSDMRGVLVSLSDESKIFEVDLALEILKHGGTPLVGSTTMAGRVYRFWIDVKEVITGKDPMSVLRACEYAENGVRALCQKVLHHPDITTGMQQKVRNQQASFRISYDAVNGHGDMKIALK
jgi:uncharacterized protein (TIGR02284 family)